MEIKQYLKEKGIKFKIYKHPPVYTVEQAKKYSKKIKGVHSKNLFLKDKKSKYFYLVIIPENEKVEIDKLGKKLSTKIKFANETDLREILNLTIGAISPFGLINDKEHKTDVIIDKKIWNSDIVSFHPNINTETLELSGEDFQRYIKSLKNKFIII